MNKNADQKALTGRWIFFKEVIFHWGSVFTNITCAKAHAVQYICRPSRKMSNSEVTKFADENKLFLTAKMPVRKLRTVSEE